MFERKVTQSEFEVVVNDLMHKIKKLAAHKAEKSQIVDLAMMVNASQINLSCSKPYSGFVDVGRESFDFSYPKPKSDIETKLELMKIAGGDITKFNKMLEAINKST